MLTEEELNVLLARLDDLERGVDYLRRERVYLLEGREGLERKYCSSVQTHAGPVPDVFSNRNAGQLIRARTL